MQPPHRRIGAIVALVWGRHVSLLDVPLAAPHEEPGAGTPHLSPVWREVEESKVGMGVLS